MVVTEYGEMTWVEVREEFERPSAMAIPRMCSCECVFWILLGGGMFALTSWSMLPPSSKGGLLVSSLNLSSARGGMGGTTIS